MTWKQACERLRARLEALWWEQAILLAAVKSGDVSDEAVESVIREFKHALPEVLVEPPFLRGEEDDGVGDTCPEACFGPEMNAKDPWADAGDEDAWSQAIGKMKKKKRIVGLNNSIACASA